MADLNDCGKQWPSYHIWGWVKTYGTKCTSYIYQILAAVVWGFWALAISGFAIIYADGKLRACREAPKIGRVPSRPIPVRAMGMIVTVDRKHRPHIYLWYWDEGKPGWKWQYTWAYSIHSILTYDSDICSDREWPFECGMTVPGHAGSGPQ